MKREDSVVIEQFGRPTWLEIDLACVRGNYHVIRGMVPAKTHILCVVKDDAYGHGAVDVTRVLQEEGANWFALATLEEALELRRAGIKGRMLVFGSVPASGVQEAIAQNITLSVPNDDVVRELVGAAAGKQLKVKKKKNKYSRNEERSTRS